MSLEETHFAFENARSRRRNRKDRFFDSSAFHQFFAALQGPLWSWPAAWVTRSFVRKDGTGQLATQTYLLLR